MKSFASDNNAGVCPEVLEAIARANVGHVKGYGDDPYSDKAREKFKEHFGPQSEAFFVFNGTAANVLSLNSIMDSYQAVLCSSTAHIYTDECGAPERVIGSKLIPVSTPDGKLTPLLLENHLGGRGDEHHVQVKAISITQSTELGTVYSLDEIKALAKFAHSNQLSLHMDGARLSNAAASLKCSYRELVSESGIDVLSYGGTKNGILGGEVVVFLGGAPKNFKYQRKQLMQLASKSRFIAVQFEALLTDNLWYRNASHANTMAKFLEKQLAQFSEIKIKYPVQSNAIFAQIPKAMISRLQQKFFFYVWNERESIVRWMTSFDTTESEIAAFIDAVKQANN